MTATRACDRVTVRVRCSNPECGDLIEKPLGWLIAAGTLTCAYCSTVIDLKRGENGLVIQKLAEACTAIDSSITNRALP